MIKELRLWLATLFWWLKMLASLVGASFCMGMESLLFFTIQEVWKELTKVELSLGRLMIFALVFLIYHTPFLAGVLWFSWKVQKLWERPVGAQ